MANETQMTKMKVRVPNLNGFDKSHEHYTTCKTGTLVPVLVDEILPNSTISLGALANIDLTPFVTEFNGKIDFRLEAFFVPTRTMWGGAMNFFAQQNQYDPSLPVPTSVPMYNLTAAREGVIRSDIPSMEDYMGYPLRKHVDPFPFYNALPMLAYGKVFEDWYRDSRVQKALFVPTDVANNALANLPFVQNSPQSPIFSDSAVYNDGKHLYDLRQRLYDRDYFTTANLKNKLDETLHIDIVDDKLTIQAIRQINALTRFSELLAGVGNKYEDVLKAVYGCYPKGLAHDRSIYLGQMRSRIYNNTTFRTTSTEIDNDGTLSFASSPDVTRNPYGQMAGSSTSNPSSTQSNSLIDKFTTSEHGYLIVLASVVPIASYSTGSRKFVHHLAYSDFGNNLFAGMGNQPILATEVADNEQAVSDSIFAWTDRYAEYKYINDRVSGQFKDGRAFDAFSLKRAFTGSTTLSTAFLEIGTSDLDDVTVNTGSSYYGSHRLNLGFKYYVSQPLPSYSIPTLEMLENQHTESVNKGGVHL